MSGIVVQEFERAPLADIAALAEFGVATIHEAQGRMGLLASHMRPIYAGAAAAGNAVTVSVPPGDNWMIHVAVEVCREGDILVVAPTAPATTAISASCWPARSDPASVRGLIIEAGCRDVKALTEMKFPVWSRAVSAQGTVKESLGDVNLPLVIAGQLVNPGDVVVADDDGVVIVARNEVRGVTAKSREREEKEAKSREKLRRASSASTSTACATSSRPRPAHRLLRRQALTGRGAAACVLRPAQDEAGGRGGVSSSTVMSMYRITAMRMRPSFDELRTGVQFAAGMPATARGGGTRAPSPPWRGTRPTRHPA